jgi:hypothetical protein
MSVTAGTVAGGLHSEIDAVVLGHLAQKGVPQRVCPDRVMCLVLSQLFNGLLFNLPCKSH